MTSVTFQKALWAKGILSSAVTHHQFRFLNGENLQGPEQHKRTHKPLSREWYHSGKRESASFFKRKSPFCKRWAKIYCLENPWQLNRTFLLRHASCLLVGGSSLANHTKEQNERTPVSLRFATDMWHGCHQRLWCVGQVLTLFQCHNL